MTPEFEVIGLVVGALRDLEVPYMVTGSLASSFHGRPRTTNDADIVIGPTKTQVARLVETLLRAGFYVDADAANRAFVDRRQFNAIHKGSAVKIDLILLKDRPFSVSEFERRWTRDAMFGQGVFIVSPEDAMLSKLEWAKLGGSGRQIEDARGIWELNPNLDRDYLERWARELGVSDLLAAVTGHRPA